MQTLLFAFVLGSGCGVIGAVYRFVLAYEKILSWWFRFGNRFERRWFFKPVWGCAKCFAGQMAGWSWLVVAIIPAILTHCGRHGGEIQFSTHTTQTAGLLVVGVLIAICVAITVALVLGPILENKNER